MTENAALPRRRRMRASIVVPFCSLAILFLGWTALWLFGRHEVARVMDGWIGEEQSRGRSWTCPGREIAGFPLSIRVVCSAPTFRGRLGGQSVEGSLSGLQVEVLVYRPNSIEAAVAGPLTIHQQDDRPDVTVRWSSLKVAARGFGARRQRAALVAENLEFDAPDGTNHADRLEFRIGPTPTRPVQDKAYDVFLTLDNALVPAFDALTRDKEPVSVHAQGVLTHLDVTRIAPWPELAESWRVAGGALSVSTLTVAKGPLHIDAQGDLGLDGSHRVSGRLRAALSGYEALMTQLAVPLPAVSAGGVLAQLWNRGSTTPRAEAGANPAVTLPIGFVDGRMLVGPFRTGWHLPPLY